MMRMVLVILLVTLYAGVSPAMDHNNHPPEEPEVCRTMALGDFLDTFSTINPIAHMVTITGKDRENFIARYNMFSQIAPPPEDVVVIVFAKKGAQTVYLVFAVHNCIYRASPIPIPLFIELMK